MTTENMKLVNYFYHEFREVIESVLNEKGLDSKYVFDEYYNRNISLRTLKIRDSLFNSYLICSEFANNKESSMTLQVITDIEQLAMEKANKDEPYSFKLLKYIYKTFEFEFKGKGVRTDLIQLQDI